jgi:hypothetical protein
MILNHQTDTPASYSTNINDDQPINIVRLVEDETITKKIKFDEMSVEGLVNPQDIQGGNRMQNEFGITFPIIRINDLIIPRFNITSMVISSVGFMPTISLSLVFFDKTFISKNMPKDGDILSLYLRVNTDALSYLRNEFIITSCVVTNGKNGNMNSKITINGRMFIPKFDSKKTSIAYTGTTKQVLRQIAKDYEIGFAFNDFDDTNDFQTWIKHKQSTENFINEIVSRSWKDETSFFKSWIDLYYNICFVNINKFLLSTENEETVDLTFATNTFGISNITDNDTTIENTKMSIKALTNSSYFKDSPFFIKKWEPTNNSTSISLKNGYSTTTHTFIHNQNYLSDNQTQCFESLNNIPAYDQSKIDSYMLLRGRSKYDKNKNPDKEKARVNYDYVNTYNNDVWTGIQYVLDDSDINKHSNKWSGNVHKNYSRAPYHNSQNINELNKLYLTVYCDGLNLQIMRGERIPVYIVFNGSYEESSYNSFSENDLEMEANRFYSGYYIVDSIEFIYNPGKNDTTPYTTKYILKRREWPTPEAI